MISEIAEAGIRPQFDHPAKVYCASALTNLTVDTGVASASRPLVCFIDIDVVIKVYCNAFLCTRVEPRLLHRVMFCVCDGLFT